MPACNAAGIALIKSFESCELTAYADSGGIPTVGWGHTGPDVVVGMTITQAEADALFLTDLQSSVDAVAAAVEVVLNPNQFSALVSFEYNTGSLPGSPGLRLINENAFSAAWEYHFCLWVQDANGNVLPGLVLRRSAEKALFFAS